MNTGYNVYWIHLPTHTDISKDGYVGVSNNPKRRLFEHRKSKNGFFANAIRKYGSDILVMDVIHSNLTLDQAMKIEKELRPEMRIGWNIMTGGSVPPSNKGQTRSQHSEMMRGPNNPFFGKNHTDEAIQFFREQKSGSNNPFYGKKRPDHSAKLKEKRGSNYPKFRGNFLTPFGKFSSYKDAIDTIGMKITSLYVYCFESNKPVTNLSYSKSSILQKLGNREEIVGKTYRELGFDFEYV